MQFSELPTAALAASIILAELSTPWSEPLPWESMPASSTSITPSWHKVSTNGRELQIGTLTSASDV
ncbi:hypothetical protein IMZ48_08125 [Candidatus Bathyarchaeota archaeon]|nr:hypothetical protein [Candidatus Bathyarchaeota archaeon]